MKTNTILLIAAIVIGLILIFKIDQCGKKKVIVADDTQLINSLSDSIRYYKNKDSNNVARISVMQTEGTKRFLDLQIKNREIQDLQKTVGEYRDKLKAGNSVTQGLLETLIEQDKAKPTLIVKRDTVRQDSLVYIWPVYRDTIDNQWISSDITLGKDTSHTSIKIRNNFKVIVGTDKGKPFVDLITDNPYSEVKTLRSYQVALSKVKRWGVGLHTGYGFITSDNGFKRGTYIGAGLSYDIIRF